MARKRNRKRATKRRRPGGDPALAGRSAAEREIEALIERIRARALEAQSPDTPTQRVAEIIVEDFEALPSPVGLIQTLTAGGSAERARAVVAAVSERAPGSVTALTLAAEAARELDHDGERAAALLDDALGCSDAESDPGLAEHLLAAGDALGTLDCLHEPIADDPTNERLLEMQALALEQLHRASGSRRRRAERDALHRFADRTLLYGLRDALRERVEADPELRADAGRRIRDWLDDAGMLDDEPLLAPGDGEEEELDPTLDALVRTAIERSWLSAPEEAEEDLDPPPSFADSRTPLAAVAADPELPADVREAAFDWWDTCSYGLWLVEDPEPRPGVWLTEIASGARRYVAIAPEQLDCLHRWSVILGPLVALGGAWRTGGTFVSLRPSEGDSAAAVLKDAAADIIRSLEGKRARGRRWQPSAEPHGVLVGEDGPADPAYVELVSTVCGFLMPTLAGELSERRRAGPTIRTMDGEAVVLLTADVRLRDGVDLEAALGDHPDVRIENDGELTWWGRELTDTERETATAELRARLGDEREQEPIVDLDERPRWLRGRINPTPEGANIEVNSRERLEALVDLLAGAGLQPTLTREAVIDPREDLPALGPVGPLPFGSCAREITAWRERWLDASTPALGGSTPRRAARRERERPLLEAVLRELEHDADILARRGEPIPDFVEIRAELAMTRDAR